MITVEYIFFIACTKKVFIWNDKLALDGIASFACDCLEYGRLSLK